MYPLFDIAKLSGHPNHTEINVAIVHKNKVILSDDQAIHTVHNFEDPVTPNLTAIDILSSTPIGHVDNIGSWVQSFGDRLERNYKLLLNSIKEIGLNPKDFPRKTT